VSLTLLTIAMLSAMTDHLGYLCDRWPHLSSVMVSCWVASFRAGYRVGYDVALIPVIRAQLAHRRVIDELGPCTRKTLTTRRMA
jgi:hypothetical protein